MMAANENEEKTCDECDGPLASDGACANDNCDSRKKTCPDCNGDGFIDCDECSGSGEGDECSNCEEGVTEDDETCDECGGNGYDECGGDSCGSMGDGKVECMRCNGEGEISE
jgi:hypothetical protein